MSQLETPTETKEGHFVPVDGSNRDKRLRGPFVPVGVSNRDKRPMSPLLARLAVGPGTKVTYCPGPKGCQDKWPGTKAYFVVVAAGSGVPRGGVTIELDVGQLHVSWREQRRNQN